MIVWSGFGIVVPFVAFIVLLISQVLIDSVLGEGYYIDHSWPKLAACAVTAVALWFLGVWLNKPRQDGSRYFHSLFFIPVQYWSIATLLLGIFFMFE